jgi:hypothetical protein
MDRFRKSAGTDASSLIPTPKSPRRVFLSIPVPTEEKSPYPELLTGKIDIPTLINILNKKIVSVINRICYVLKKY